MLYVTSYSTLERCYIGDTVLIFIGIVNICIEFGRNKDHNGQGINSHIHCNDKK